MRYDRLKELREDMVNSVVEQILDDLKSSLTIELKATEALELIQLAMKAKETGLIDKYGREIYEGDIVEVRAKLYYYTRGEVIYSPEFAGFIVRNHEHRDGFKDTLLGWIIKNGVDVELELVESRNVELKDLSKRQLTRLSLEERLRQLEE